MLPCIFECSFFTCSFAYITLPINVCGTDCDGDEDKLIECDLFIPCTSSVCTHNDDIGVSCSKLLYSM